MADGRMEHIQGYSEQVLDRSSIAAFQINSLDWRNAHDYDYKAPGRTRARIRSRTVLRFHQRLRPDSLDGGTRRRFRPRVSARNQVLGMARHVQAGTGAVDHRRPVELLRYFAAKYIR
jgi:hypothetical protein